MRKKFIAISLAAMVGMLGGAATALTRQQAPPTLNIAQVTPGLHVITGGGANTAVRVAAEGVIVVDDKFEQNYDQIIERVRSVSNQPIKYVFNTHHHGDHSGGNVRFAEIAPIVAHRNARENILRANQPGPQSIVFSDQTSVFVGGVEARALHLGCGHTNGDSVVYFPDLRVVHVGDLISVNPFIDWEYGGCGAGWPTTLANILALDFETAIPGHGDPMTRQEVEEFKTKFETMIQRGRTLISEGVSRADFPARLNTQEFGWNYGNERQLMTPQGLYDELSARR